MEKQSFEETAKKGDIPSPYLYLVFSELCDKIYPKRR